MKKKIMCITIIIMFLLMGFSASLVYGNEKIYDNQNQNFSISNITHYSNTIYNLSFNKDDVTSVTRWCFEDDTLTHSGERNVYIDNISTVSGIDDFEDGKLDTPMPWYGNVDELSMDNNSQVYGIYSAKLHSKESYKEVKRDFETPLTGDGVVVKASIKIDTQGPDWRGDHADVVLDEYDGSPNHEILCVKFMDNSGIYEYQNPQNKIFDYWLTGLIYDVIIELDFTHQTANITVEFEWDGHPPDKPSKPSGPINVTEGVEYTYTTSTTDPDGDQLYYVWDWGGGSPGTYSWGVGPYNSGETSYASHIWESQGSYNIRVKAIDEYGAQSDWSDPLEITVPRNRAVNRPFFNFLDDYPILYQLLQRFLNN